jgi:hypothetical protein
MKEELVDFLEYVRCVVGIHNNLTPTGRQNVHLYSHGWYFGTEYICSRCGEKVTI